MDKDELELVGLLVSKSYAQQAQCALSKRRKLIKSLLSERRLPQQGWDETSIEQLLQVTGHDKDDRYRQIPSLPQFLAN